MTDADGNDFYLSDPHTGRQFIFDYNHMSEFSRGRGTGLPQVPYNAVTKSYAYSPISNTLDATAKLINAVGHREARKQSTGRCFWVYAPVPRGGDPSHTSTHAPPLFKQLFEILLNIAIAFA